MTRAAFAFFDVDDTLIAIKSMFDFWPFWCRGIGRPEEIAPFEARFSAACAAGSSREVLNRLYYAQFRGAPLDRLVAQGRAWHRARFEPGESLFLAPVVAALEAHRAEGVAPVLVSGSMPPLLAPLAAQLGIEHCLCTRLVTDAKGVLTGEIGDPQTIGAGKAAAIRAFLAEHAVQPDACFAYGDDISDLPMLESVGHPVVVGAEPGLLAVGLSRHWSRIAA